MTTSPETDAPVAPPSTPPRRGPGRRVARRIAILRDVLASIKDAGIIGIVLALLFFHDDVGGFLADLELVRDADDRVVDVGGSLARLNRALDAAVPVASASAPVAPLGSKVLRAERRLLRSTDAAFIDDWVVVVAGASDPAQAAALSARLATLSLTPDLYQKAGQWRVVVPAGSPEAVQSVLNRVRPHFPRALPTTLSSWCPSPPAGTAGCRRA